MKYLLALSLFALVAPLTYAQDQNHLRCTLDQDILNTADIRMTSANTATLSMKLTFSGQTADVCFAKKLDVIKTDSRMILKGMIDCVESNPEEVVVQVDLVSMKAVFGSLPYDECRWMK